MDNNFTEINTSKTTFLNISPYPTYFPPILSDNIVISPSPTASNLDLLFDSTLSFNPHINVIIKSANYHIFRNTKIRKSITVSITKTLVNSIIYYCSSHLINIPLYSLSPLNRVIRSSIRTTYNLRIRDHSSTSSYQDLPPWFLFNKRSAYSILSIVHSSIYSTNCHSYISASLVQISFLPYLRNHEYHLLSTSIIHSSKMNTRVLSYIGHKLCKSLPSYIRSIRSHKTFNTYIHRLIAGGNLILFVIIVLFINFLLVYSILFYCTILNGIYCITYFYYLYFYIYIYFLELIYDLSI